MNERIYKGNSIIALPNDYVILDTETTGLDFWFDDIIEVAAIRYKDNCRVSEFTSLVNPGRRIPEFITQLTGITTEMVAGAPKLKQVLPQLMDFVGDAVIVGQNITFDINFLYDGTVKNGLSPIRNDHINIIRIARKVYPELDNYRLETIAKACGIKYTGAHRSLSDCEITAACYDHLKGKALNQMSEAEFVDLFKKKGGQKQSYSDFISSLDLSNIEPDEDHPIFGKCVVFTGELTRMKRKDALALVAQLGGTPADSITKKVNYLVVGNEDFVQSVKDGRTGKMKKAEALALKGHDIHIISEDTFFQMVDDN